MFIAVSDSRPNLEQDRSPGSRSGGRVSNHIFVDGSKGIDIYVMLTFPEVNGTFASKE